MYGLSVSLEQPRVPIHSYSLSLAFLGVRDSRPARYGERHRESNAQVFGWEHIKIEFPLPVPAPAPKCHYGKTGGAPEPRYMRTYHTTLCSNALDFDYSPLVDRPRRLVGKEQAIQPVE